MRGFLKGGNNGVGCQTVQCPKSDLGTDLCNTVTKVTSQKKTTTKKTQTKKQIKEKNLLMKFSAEATFQTLINAEEDRHVIH